MGSRIHSVIYGEGKKGGRKEGGRTRKEKEGKDPECYFVYFASRIIIAFHGPWSIVYCLLLIMVIEGGGRGGENRKG
jgi:hypothetical protein